MLLRRVIKHVKDQNWVAVALDFLIVVTGVFMGIQLGNWNEARQEREREREYLVRLHDEAQVSLNGLLVWASEYLKPRFEAYEEIVGKLGETPATAMTLSDEQCDIIGNMHDFIAFPSQFPSLAEIAASGQFDILRDPDVRQTLTSYRLMKDQATVLIANLNTAPTVLPNEFPAYFTANLSIGTPGRELFYSDCDAPAMFADKAFVNRFADLASRYNQYYNIVIDQERVRVTNLHRLLDEKLGINHNTDA